MFDALENWFVFKHFHIIICTSSETEKNRNYWVPKYNCMYPIPSLVPVQRIQLKIWSPLPPTKVATNFLNHERYFEKKLTKGALALQCVNFLIWKEHIHPGIPGSLPNRSSQIVFWSDISGFCALTFSFSEDFLE